MTTVTLSSSDSAFFEVPYEIAAMSGIIKDIINDSEEGETIPIHGVTGDVLGKIIEFCKHHAETPMMEIKIPLETSDTSKIMSEWDAEYASDVDINLLLEMLRAADFLDIKPLVNLLCVKAALKIKGKTHEEVCKNFNITNDFTPEEKESIGKMNSFGREG